ncbi:MAG: hypothetical protein J6C91_10865 [Muribaculaceae bacterium]|nr:hypothetical protein [Muribaculaceae bacterium]
MKNRIINILRLMGGAAAVVGAVVMTSCSKESTEIMELIPADSRGFVILSDKFAQEAGIAPGNMSNTSSAIAANYEYALVQSSASNEYKVLVPDDVKSFTKALADSGYTNVTDGNFDVYSKPSADDIVVARDGRGVWITNRQRPAEFVASELEAAVKSPMSKVNWVAEYVKSNIKLFAGAVSERVIGAGEDGSWYCFSGEQKDKVLAVEFNITGADGNPVELKGLQTIDTDFLRYVPAGQGVFAAVGLTKDMDWDAAGKMAASLGGTEVSTYVDAIMPYLKSVDGTVAVAVMPDHPESLTAWKDPTMWNLLFMARMPQEKVNEAVNTLSLLAKMGGGTVTDAGQGVKVLNAGGVQVYAGNTDGNLAISTMPLTGKAQNELNSVFAGKNGALEAYVPGTLVFDESDTGFNVKLVVQLEKSNGRIEMTLPGCDETPLKKIISFLN